MGLQPLIKKWQLFPPNAEEMVGPWFSKRVVSLVSPLDPKTAAGAKSTGWGRSRGENTFLSGF